MEPLNYEADTGAGTGEGLDFPSGWTQERGIKVIEDAAEMIGQCLAQGRHHLESSL